MRAVLRQAEQGEIGLGARRQGELEGSGAIARFQRLGEGGELDAFRRLEQLAGGLAHQAVAAFLDQILGGAGREQNGALPVPLEQEIGIGKGKAQKAGAMRHEGPGLTGLKVPSSS